MPRSSEYENAETNCFGEVTSSFHGLTISCYLLSLGKLIENEFCWVLMVYMVLQKYFVLNSMMNWNYSSLIR